MFSRVFRPTIRDERELRRFVIVVTLCCVGVALAVDVANQLAFFVDWASTLRSWAITFVEATGLAAPISYGIGGANLELYRAKQEADTASHTDPMTGLMNRRALTERVQSLQTATLVLVIADIDHFKRVNDTYGHLVGDFVIAAVARMMANALAEFGPLARVGGEEFALLASGLPADEIVAHLNAARARIAATPLLIEGRVVRVTISAGLATGAAEDGFDKLYAEADRALYFAKLSGRDRVLSFDDVIAFEREAPGLTDRRFRDSAALERVRA